MGIRWFLLTACVLACMSCASSQRDNIQAVAQTIAPETVSRLIDILFGFRPCIDGNCTHDLIQMARELGVNISEVPKNYPNDDPVPYCIQMRPSTIETMKKLEYRHNGFSEVKYLVLEDVITYVFAMSSVRSQNCSAEVKLLDFIINAAGLLREQYIEETRGNCVYTEVDESVFEKDEAPIKNPNDDPVSYCIQMHPSTIETIKKLEYRHSGFSEVKYWVLEDIINYIFAISSLRSQNCAAEVKLLDFIIFAADALKGEYIKETRDNCVYTEVDESVFEGKPAVETPQSQTTAKPDKENATTTPKGLQTEKTTEKPCEVTTTEKPCEVTTTEKPCEVTTTEKPCEVTTTEKPCEVTTTEKPCEVTTTEKPCEVTTTEKPCEVTTTEKPCEVTTTEKPCEVTTTEKPCEVTTTEKPCQEGEEVIAEKEYNDKPTIVGSMRGAPGVHYPNYTDIPLTSFSCADKKYIPGFYADLETGCQVFHVCYEHRRESFLCPVGTIFNQPLLACDYWYSSNCSMAPVNYEVNSKKDEKEEISVLVDEFVSIVGKDDTAKTSGSSGKQILENISEFLPYKAKVVSRPVESEMKKGKQSEAQVVEDVASDIFDKIIGTATDLVSKTRGAIEKLPEPGKEKLKPEEIFKPKDVIPVFKLKKSAKKPLVKAAVTKAKLATAVPAMKLAAVKAAVPVVAKTKLAAAALPVVATKAKIAASVPLAVKAKVSAKGKLAAVPKIVAKASIPAFKAKMIASAVPLAKAKIAVPALKAKSLKAAALPLVKAKSLKAAALPLVKAKSLKAAALPLVKAKSLKAAALPLVKAKSLKAAALPLVKAKSLKAAALPLVKAKMLGVPLAKSALVGAAPVVKAKLLKAAAISPLTKKTLALGYMKLLKAKKLKKMALMG